MLGVKPFGLHSSFFFVERKNWSKPQPDLLNPTLHPKPLSIPIEAPLRHHDAGKRPVTTRAAFRSDRLATPRDQGWDFPTGSNSEIKQNVPLDGFLMYLFVFLPVRHLSKSMLLMQSSATVIRSCGISFRQLGQVVKPLSWAIQNGKAEDPAETSTAASRFEEWDDMSH